MHAATDTTKEGGWLVQLEMARTIIEAGFSSAGEQGMQPLAIAVLDSGGHVVAFQRQDGASLMRFQIAYGKAFGALGMGVGSRRLMEMAVERPYFVAAASTAVGGALIPVPGGVLALDEAGSTVGAVGVTGDVSDNDEAIAVSGIEAAGLVPESGG